MAITPAQIRAARALLGWTLDELSEKSGISRRTLTDLESGTHKPQRRTLDKLRACHAKHGIAFVSVDDQPGGVILIKPR
jgi:transcriptional regulator with XRE-family HTH domain